jgi:hypothetical protein
MTTKNNMSGSIKLGGIVIAILTIGIGIYSTFHVPLAKAIASEVSARMTSDKDISDRFTEKLTEAVLSQVEVNQQILISLAEVKTELKSIRKERIKE